MAVQEKVISATESVAGSVGSIAGGVENGKEEEKKVEEESKEKLSDSDKFLEDLATQQANDSLAEKSIEKENINALVMPTNNEELMKFREDRRTLLNRSQVGYRGRMDKLNLQRLKIGGLKNGKQ